MSGLTRVRKAAASTAATAAAAAAGRGRYDDHDVRAPVHGADHDAPQDRFRGGAPVPPTEVVAAPVDS